MGEYIVSTLWIFYFNISLRTIRYYSTNLRFYAIKKGAVNTAPSLVLFLKNLAVPIRVITPYPTPNYPKI
jgi:hypothetical protein